MTTKLRICAGLALLSGAFAAHPASAGPMPGVGTPAPGGDLVLVANPQPPAGEGAEARSTMDKLKAQLTAMGYEPKVDGKHASIDTGDFVINFNLSGDNATLFAYSFFSVTPEQAAKAPLQDLLAFNDDADAYFSVHLADKKIDSVALNRTMTAKDMSPMTLRRMVDRLNGYGHDHLAIFAPNNWK